MNEAIGEIAFFDGFSGIKPINEGYSIDKKFVVFKAGKKYLLRTFEAEFFAEKEKEFHALNNINALSVKCSKALEMGHLESSKTGYMILTFIDGNDGRKELPRMSVAEQFKVGIEAGRELKKIHQYKAPMNIVNWHDRKSAKHARHLKAYQSGDERFAGEDNVIRFIEQNIKLMENRPNIFQHDDFHLSNLIIENCSFAGVIDFGRHDWGDPVHEFLKVGQFSSEVSVPFSVGQIMGYFNGNHPDEDFWKLYSLYSAMSLFSMVVWTKHVCPQEMGRSMEIIKRVLADHNYFELIQPKWYSKGEFEIG